LFTILPLIKQAIFDFPYPRQNLVLNFLDCAGSDSAQ
jgi:hypothetical protein